MHGSVGPSCAVANVTSAPDANGIQATVWSGTQGVYPLQQALAQHPRASAIRGQGHIHRGRRLLRPQWCRRRGRRCRLDVPARRATRARAVDALGRTCMGAARPRDGAHAERRSRFSGNVVAWSHTVYSPPHNSRPGGGGSLLAGQEIGLMPPSLPTVPVNAGTRNAPVNYNFPAIKLTANHVQPFQTTSNGAAASPLVNTLPRSSALRSLGGMSNCFANELFMDELALAANADPIAFRKKYVCALSGSSGSATSVAGAAGGRSASRRRARRDGPTGRMGQPPRASHARAPLRARGSPSCATRPWKPTWQHMSRSK